MKRNPDFIINYDNFLESKKNYKQSLNKSGVYVYTFKNQAIYVGATKNIYQRTFRIYKNSSSATRLFHAIAEVLGYRNLIIEIFLCDESDLLKYESKIFNKRQPLSQLISGNIFYTDTHKRTPINGHLTE